jgi:hypothetical protein
MRTRMIAAAGLTLALVACGKPADKAAQNGVNEVSVVDRGDANAVAANSAPSAAAPSNVIATADALTSTAPSAPAAAEGLKLRPGLYESSTDMKIEGLPPQLAKVMNGTKMTDRSCVTPEEANRPSSELFGGKKAEGCQQKDLVYAGGRIHGVLICPAKSGGEASQVTMDGTYSADSFDMHTRIVTHGAGSQGMAMEGHMTAHRVGECTGKEK